MSKTTLSLTEVRVCVSDHQSRQGDLPILVFRVVVPGADFRAFGLLDEHFIFPWTDGICFVSK